MRHIKTYRLFEAWEPKFDRNAVWEAIPWNDGNYVDLYPGYSDEPPYPNGEEYWFDSKENAEEHADFVIDVFDSLPNPIPLYRSIKAESEDKIDMEWPGESWSFDRDSAVNFGSRNGSNFLLTAKVMKEDVNWAGTIKAYMLFSGGYTDEDENEIVVDDQDKLIDLRVEPIK